VAFVDPKIAATVAHMAGTKKAVRDERDKLAAVAEGLFAPHDNPGGHSITKTNPAGTDALVSIVGPAALSVEFGHWQRLADGSWDNLFVEGLHILGRAIAQEAL
jgi:hypothetical protein